MEFPLLVGLGLLIFLFVFVIAKFPDDTTYFTKDSQSHQVNAGETKTVFLEEGSKFDNVGAVNCTAKPFNHSGSLEFHRYDKTLIANDEQALFDLTTSHSGEYAISCKGLPGATYAIGNPITSNTANAVTMLQYGFLIVPALALVTAATISGYVAVKRKRFKQTLN